MAEAEADIFYVSEKYLKTVKEKLEKKEDIDTELVNKLTIPDDLADEEMMVPVDMRGVDGDFDDVEAMVSKLGPKGAAEAFVKAHAFFEKNPDKEPEEERPKPMSAQEWREVLEQGQEGAEEEEFLGGFEGEEEEFLDAEEAEEEEAEEPAAKKAKTD